ncbi:CRAL/TRIO domain-containing protein [Roridomyces roridus]|uniref:CRAL/TRIO domain-containing protein n=1 Tax=Roridomyces roridus TaxID=1738132 RepID=A0AAD7FYB4_9AGAR|nr:CRAL/TRIO domain-containing protein [Roridomyces roridus]
MSKVYLPIQPPENVLASSQPELTESQKEMQQAVTTHFETSEYDSLMDVEKMWLSYECILRFLRGSKWKVDVAITRLNATLKWRREYGVYDTLSAENIEPEAVTGKQVLLGFDTANRPALYLIPSRQNTTNTVTQIQFSVWMLERCIDLMPPNVESLDLLINFADKAKNPSLGTARGWLSILQDHYPERLGLALVIKVPFILTSFFTLISPFIDPVTRNKIKFNPKVMQDKIFEPEMVMSEWWDGACNFEYDHGKYWPALVSLCKDRTELWTANWRKLGGKVGVKELDYKTGTGVLEAPSDAVDPTQ